jgi:hypothetical protein
MGEVSLELEELKIVEIDLSLVCWREVDAGSPVLFKHARIIRRLIRA